MLIEMRKKAMRRGLMTFLVTGLLALTACSSSGIKSEAKYPTGMDRDQATDNIYADTPSVFGGSNGGGLSLFGHDSNKADYSGESGIGVNSYLWRAALDTVSFMPLASADPFGGVILTDWYDPPESKNERFKLNVFILDRQLRSDGIQVKVFRQVKRGSTWQDAAVADGTARQLEDAILTRARQLRVSQMGQIEN